jgi:hypothetical protein
LILLILEGFLKSHLLRLIGIFHKSIKKPSLLSRGGGFTTDATSKVDITSHDSDTLAVDGAKVDILEEGDEVSFSSLLESSNGSALETEVSLAILSNFTDKALEGELADQKLSGLLVATDLTKSNGTWAITMGLLDSSSGWGRLAGSLSWDHLTGSLTTSGFASSLLSTGHLECVLVRL